MRQGLLLKVSKRLELYVELKQNELNLSLSKLKSLYFYIILESRPDEAFFGKLDSNLKKNTAFVKKLVNLILNLALVHLDDILSPSRFSC